MTEYFLDFHGNFMTHLQILYVETINTLFHHSNMDGFYRDISDNLCAHYFMVEDGHTVVKIHIR